MLYRQLEDHFSNPIQSKSPHREERGADLRKFFFHWRALEKKEKDSAGH